MLRRFKEAVPKIHPSAYVHPSSELIGRVIIERNASIWPMVVLRGDIERIRIGPDCNVQDSTVIHTTRKIPVTLEKGVTIGHAAILHGTHIGRYSLIGMGAILLDGSVIGPECLIGAGAVIKENARIPARSLVLGLPGRVMRSLTKEEIAGLHKRANDYIDYAADHRKHSSPV
jgi:carbonic anhydrase/acetyltransferase-like protein (isoleucine patch superfamily)